MNMLSRPSAPQNQLRIDHGESVLRNVSFIMDQADFFIQVSTLSVNLPFSESGYYFPNSKHASGQPSLRLGP
jgi:hypothetical protein